MRAKSKQSPASAPPALPTAFRTSRRKPSSRLGQAHFWRRSAPPTEHSYGYAALEQCHRPFASCERRPSDGRPFARRHGGRLLGLGGASRLIARKANAARRKGGAQELAFRQLRLALRAAAERHALHRAAAAGQEVFRRSVAAAGPMRCSTRFSCSISNGGTTPRRASAASPSSMKTSSNSPRGNCSTCSRRRISC